MAQLIVRNIEEEVKTKLRRRARKHGRSTEAEVREILRDAVREEPGEPGLGSTIAAIFADGGLEKDEDIPEQRGYPVKPIDFDS
jgi:plasmid stability protein